MNLPLVDKRGVKRLSNYTSRTQWQSRTDKGEGSIVFILASLEDSGTEYMIPGEYKIPIPVDSQPLVLGYLVESYH